MAAKTPRGAVRDWIAGFHDPRFYTLLLVSGLFLTVLGAFTRPHLLFALGWIVGVLLATACWGMFMWTRDEVAREARQDRK